VSKFVIYNMDVFDGLKQMQKEGIKVDAIMTSPPYWGLRDYGIEGQIGLEEHPYKYINKLVKVFRECRKVLKPEGSLWLNLGDTYCGGHKGGSIYNKKQEEKMRAQIPQYDKGRPQSKPVEKFMVEKQKMLMPHRVAIALQEDGWILRNDVVWHKPSHMPSSVKDRLTNSFEFVFHFVQQRKYFYDLDAIREPHKQESIERAGRAVSNSHKYSGRGNNPKNTRPNIKEFVGRPMHSLHLGRQNIKELKNKGVGGENYLVRELNPAGKNPSDFWSINPKPFPEAHFACYPSKLCEKPLKATVPRWICKKCGKPRERITKLNKDYKQINEKEWIKYAKERGLNPYDRKARHRAFLDLSKRGKNYSRETVGWSDCGCGAGWIAGSVLDPFVGSGTTLLEAQNQGKNGFGIELNPDYIPLIRLRLNGEKNQMSLNPSKIKIVKKDKGAGEVKKKTKEINEQVKGIVDNVEKIKEFKIGTDMQGKQWALYGSWVIVDGMRFGITGFSEKEVKKRISDVAAGDLVMFKFKKSGNFMNVVGGIKILEKGSLVK